jgi:hypothetical protein
MLADPAGAGRAPTSARPGTILVREWQGTTHHVTVVADGFIWNGGSHSSLSAIARAITGTKWIAGAAIGNELKARAGFFLKQQSADMRNAADPGGSRRRPVRVRFQPGNETL